MSRSSQRRVTVATSAPIFEGKVSRVATCSALPNYRVVFRERCSQRDYHAAKGHTKLGDVGDILRVVHAERLAIGGLQVQEEALDQYGR